MRMPFPKRVGGLQQIIMRRIYGAAQPEMGDPPKKKMHKGESPSEGHAGTEVIDDSKAFVQRFAVLFNSTCFSDIRLRVGEQTFYGHKFVLASASKVFEAMFGDSSTWEESRQQEIRLVEEEACQIVFYDFLRYFYCASIDMSTDKALPLLLLADKYNVQSLRNACVDYMMKHIEELPDKNKTLTWYHYSKLTGPDRLRDACKNFIVSNFNVILDAPDWVEMEREELADFMAMSELCVLSERALWEKVLIRVTTKASDISTSVIAAASKGTSIKVLEVTLGIIPLELWRKELRFNYVAKDPTHPAHKTFDRGNQYIDHIPLDYIFKVEQWLLADNNAEFRNENVELIVPLLRFCKMTPTELLTIESSPLMEEFPEVLKPKLGAAYRFHSLASNGVFLSSEQVPYRNYTSEMYSMRFQFELKSYANIPKIESRICLSCLVPYLPCLETETKQKTHYAQFQVNFYPKGHFSTISLYGNFMGRQNDNVTLKIIRQNMSHLLGSGSEGNKQYPPMLVEATLQLYSKKKELRFVGLTVSQTHVFTPKSPDLVVENVLDLARLKSEDSPFIVEGSLSGAVFIKVQQVGDHLHEGESSREATVGNVVQ